MMIIKCIKFVTILGAVLCLLGCADKKIEKSVASKVVVTFEEAMNEKEVVEEVVIEQTEKESVESINLAETNVFEEVLNGCYQLLITESDEMGDRQGFSGVWEVAIHHDKDEALEKVGYTICDVSGDGVPELVIGWIDEKSENGCYGNDIYSIFSQVGGQSECVLEGWARNRYRWMGEGRVFNIGSNGAAYTIWGLYQLKEDGSELICKDYYFTYEKDENFEKFGIYHNTTGEWDKDKSEELDITAEDVWNIEKEWEKNIQMIELTPFKDFKTNQM